MAARHSALIIKESWVTWKKQGGEKSQSLTEWMIALLCSNSESMAGPYYTPTHKDGYDDLDGAIDALRALDSAQHGGHVEADDIEASESAPFYSHHNSSYYTTHHDNASQSSLPLYRSRSQSLSKAPAASSRDGNSNSSKIPAMPQQGAATASMPYSCHAGAVDYTETVTADSLRRAQPPSASPTARPHAEHVNTLHSSTNTSSNAHDSSQSTAWSPNANTLTNSQTQATQIPHPHHQKKRIDWADEMARVFDPSTGTMKSYTDEKIEHVNGTGNNKGSAISRSASPLSMAPGMARRWSETDMEDEHGFDD